MRIALQHLDTEAVKSADRALGKHAKGRALAKAGPLRIRMGCGSAPLRNLWMNEYVKAGGVTVEVCGERIAPSYADPTIAQIVDRVFSARHPELHGRELNLDKEDRDLRTEWMDLYVEFGGRTAQICELARC